MKLLLDQNLSHRLVKTLREYYPESTQVALLGMGESLDKAIWEYARQEGYAIVTQDADFHEYSLLKCRTTEMSDHRNVGPPKCRATEMSGHYFHVGVAGIML